MVRPKTYKETTRLLDAMGVQKRYQFFFNHAQKENQSSYILEVKEG